MSRIAFFRMALAIIVLNASGSYAVAEHKTNVLRWKPPESNLANFTAYYDEVDGTQTDGHPHTSMAVKLTVKGYASKGCSGTEFPINVSESQYSGLPVRNVSKSDTLTLDCLNPPTTSRAKSGKGAANALHNPTIMFGPNDVPSFIGTCMDCDNDDEALHCTDSVDNDNDAKIDYADDLDSPEDCSCSDPDDTTDQWECENTYNGIWQPTCCPNCIRLSPIIISARGNQIELTSLRDGVMFNLGGYGPIQTSWTAAGADDAFLVLDRNANGMIDNGTELFGNATPQPLSNQANGFIALGVFDEPEHGGDADGKITNNDLVFQQLQLWTDINHDGISQPSELRPVTQTPIQGFNLDYVESRRTDQYGNQFKYISNVYIGRGGQRKFSVDVFFVQRGWSTH